MKIKKCDFINDKYYLKLIVGYTLVISIVYATLVKVLDGPAWAVSLTATLIILAGALVFFLRVRYVAKVRINNESNQVDTSDDSSSDLEVKEDSNQEALDKEESNEETKEE